GGTPVSDCSTTSEAAANSATVAKCCLYADQECNCSSLSFANVMLPDTSTGCMAEYNSGVWQADQLRQPHEIEQQNEMGDQRGSHHREEAAALVLDSSSSRFIGRSPPKRGPPPRYRSPARESRHGRAARRSSERSCRSCRPFSFDLQRRLPRLVTRRR